MQSGSNCQRRAPTAAWVLIAPVTPALLAAGGRLSAVADSFVPLAILATGEHYQRFVGFGKSPQLTP